MTNNVRRPFTPKPVTTSLADLLKPAQQSLTKIRVKRSLQEMSRAQLRKALKSAPKAQRNAVYTELRSRS